MTDVDMVDAPPQSTSTSKKVTARSKASTASDRNADGKPRFEVKKVCYEIEPFVSKFNRIKVECSSPLGLGYRC